MAVGGGAEGRGTEEGVGVGRRSGPLYVSSTKGATGHLLGAAGALESAFACLALRDSIVPPTLNLDTPSLISPAFEHVPHKAIPYQGLKHVMKNSFGFGGTNATLIFSRYESR